MASENLIMWNQRMAFFFLLKTQQNEMEAAASASTAPDKITMMPFLFFFPSGRSQCVSTIVSLTLGKHMTLAMNASDCAKQAPHLREMCVFIMLFEGDTSDCCCNKLLFIFSCSFSWNQLMLESHGCDIVPRCKLLLPCLHPPHWPLAFI